MPSFNQATIMGHLGKDPELRYTGSGKPVCNFSVATSEVWKDADGEKHEDTQWHNIVTWNRTAENCAQYLQKGSLVFLQGPIKTESYDDKKDGIKRYFTKIVAYTVKFLTPKGERRLDDQADDPEARPPASDRQAPATTPQDDDDVPF